jgi:hypothetical protein
VLRRLEASNLAHGRRYERVLRRWLELLAAYEFESEVAQAASDVGFAAGL